MSANKLYLILVNFFLLMFLFHFISAKLTDELLKEGFGRKIISDTVGQMRNDSLSSKIRMLSSETQISS